MLSVQPLTDVLQQVNDGGSSGPLICDSLLSGLIKPFYELRHLLISLLQHLHLGVQKYKIITHQNRSRLGPLLLVHFDVAASLEIPQVIDFATIFLKTRVPQHSPQPCKTTEGGEAGRVNIVRA